MTFLSKKPLKLQYNYPMEKTQLKKLFKNQGIDVIASLSPQTKRWFAKIDASSGYLFIEEKSAHLFVDSRYIEHAKKEAQNVKVNLLTKNSLQDFLKTKNYKKVAIESEYITLNQQKQIEKLIPKAKLIEIIAQDLRIIKSEQEISYIKKAAKISLKAFKKIKKEIKPGITEKQIDAMLSYELKMMGAEKNSFEPIVVSGPRGAMPHGKPSNRKIKPGELVTIDFGCVYNGYCSDITRTFAIDQIINLKLIDIQKVLKKAQKLGINAVKPGIKISEVDKICRDFIASKGYADNFTHATGHGLGIDVHELPIVTSNQSQDVVLKPGMVITVEPGIYIEGVGGIRIEDDILVTKDGYEVLSK